MEDKSEGYIESENDVWDKVKGENSPEAYKAYLDKYPEGAFVPTARMNLENLLAEAEDSIWESALLTDDIEGFKQYIQQYPNGRFTERAKEKLNEQEHKSLSPELPIEVEEELPDENKLWDIALKSNKSLDYQAYLEVFPNGQYSQEAQQTIEVKNKVQELERQFKETQALELQENIYQETKKLAEEYPDRFEVYDLFKWMEKTKEQVIDTKRKEENTVNPSGNENLAEDEGILEANSKKWGNSNWVITLLIAIIIILTFLFLFR